MKAALLCVALVIGCGGSTPAPDGAPSPGGEAPTLDPSSQPSLTSWARARLASLQSRPVVVRGPLSLGLEGTAMVISLDRVWGVCSASPDHCEGFGDEYLRGVAEALSRDHVEPSPAALRVIVRDTGYVERVARLTAERGREVLSRHVAGALHLLVVIDGGTATRVLLASELQELGLTADGAFDRALANTRAELGDPGPLAGRPGAIGLVQAHPYYGISLIAMHDLWKPVAGAMRGDLLVAVPGTEGILLADSAMPDALEQLGEATARMHALSQRPISLEIYRFTETGWAVAAATP